MKNLLKSTRNRVIAAVIVVVVVILGVVGGLFGYYSSRALPGSEVGSVHLGGMTRDEAQAAVQQHVDSLTFTVSTTAGDTEVKPEEAGLTVDVDKTIDDVFSQNLFPGIFGVSATPAVVTVDADVVEAFAASLPLSGEVEAVESSVNYDADAGQFVVKEGSAGQAIDPADLEKKLTNAVQSLQDAQIEVDAVQVEPEVTVEEAQAAADSVNQWLDTSISVTDDDGDTLEAERDTRAEWVTFTPKDGTVTPAVDSEAVTKWIKDYAEYTEEAPVTGLRNVDASGDVVATSREAEDGWEVTNVDAIADAIAGSVTSGESVNGVFEYGEATAKWEDREALASTEGWVYRPAKGEKWIDLDLGNSTVTAYEGDEVVGGPFYMVPGAPETPTVTGEYNIYLKYELQDMRGENADGSKYLTKDVPWVSYFTGGYGFHGAPWRSSFGWSGAGGSHGCVNMPVSDAKFIYDWSEMGTKVVSHH